MFRKFFSIGSTTCLLALTTVTSPGCALLGLEEEEETTTVATGSLSDVAGTWASSCAQSGSSYETRTVIFSGTDFTYQLRSFTDSSCTDPRFLVQLIYNNMSAGAQTTLDDGTSGYGLSSTVNAVSLTVQSNSLISTFNSSGVCGKSDWTLNVAGDVTGAANCLGSDQPTQGTAYGDKYKVSGTSLTLNNLGSFTKQ